MAKPFTPKSLHRIRGEDATKAYLHPVRMQIMSALVKRQRTITSMAKEMGVHPANLTHHFRKLEQAKLIKLVEKRDIGRTIEKYYRAVAEQFELNEQTGGASGEVENAVAKVLGFLREDLDIAIGKLKGDDSESAFGVLQNVAIDADDYAEFTKRLWDLAEEFKSRRKADGQAFSMALGLYPNDRDYGPTKSLHITKKRKTKGRGKNGN